MINVCHYFILTWMYVIIKKCLWYMLYSIRYVIFISSLIIDAISVLRLFYQHNSNNNLHINSILVAWEPPSYLFFKLNFEFHHHPLLLQVSSSRIIKEKLSKWPPSNLVLMQVCIAEANALQTTRHPSSLSSKKVFRIY